jgi:lipopolysaccharide cholinephosphotransferase
MRERFLDEEIRCGYTVTEKTKRLWAVELDLLEKLMEVCDRNGLRYFASYGTLLGAVRHKGFIPWDDDIDITMPRKDFDKLKLIAAEEFSYPYFLQTSENDPEHFMAGHFKLRNSTTTYKDYLNLGHSCNQGCFIDITALDNVFDDPNKRRKQIKKIEFYKTLLFAKVYGNDFVSLYDYSPREWKRYKLIAKLVSHKWLCKKFNEACKVCSNETTKLGVFTQKTGDYEFRYFERGIFEESIMLEFEHLKIPVPKEYDRYISLVWNNGMELPPEEERKQRHEAFIDTETPYKNYSLAMFTDVFKNLEGKRIFLFGAGQMFDYYMKKHGRKFRPEFLFDNDKNKWGTKKSDILIKNPEELPLLLHDNTRIIIVNIYYKEIGEQLQKLGINEYYVYLQGRKYK